MLGIWTTRNAVRLRTVLTIGFVQEARQFQPGVTEPVIRPTIVLSPLR
jgi:hypothetical protein